jgi:DNA-binding NtrC family response regulator
MEESQPVSASSVVSIRRESIESTASAVNAPTVLIATNDTAITESMRELLDAYPLKPIWAKSVEEVRVVLAKENVSACFCGFWLVDGTYRDVVRHLKRQPIEIPAIIVCAPACPNEYRDYLAALNIRAFDFICHPYRKTDMDRILRAAFSAHGQLTRIQMPSVKHGTALDDESSLRKAG